jgi:hypothetical protein
MAAKCLRKVVDLPGPFQQLEDAFAKHDVRFERHLIGDDQVRYFAHVRDLCIARTIADAVLINSGRRTATNGR